MLCEHCHDRESLPDSVLCRYCQQTLLAGVLPGSVIDGADGTATVLVTQAQFATLTTGMAAIRKGSPTQAEQELDLLKEVFGTEKALDLVQRFHYADVTLRVIHIPDVDKPRG